MNLRSVLKKVRNIFLGVLAFFLILLATISALVETETGSRWTVTRIASLVGIDVRGISGNLRTGLDIQFLEYRTDVQSYSAEQLSFRWRPVGLLYSALVVDSLRAQAVTIQPPASTDTEPAQPFNQWPHLRLPVRIHLQQLQLNNINLVQGESRMHWNQLSGSSLSWGTFNFRYNNVALVHDDYMLHLTGVSELGFPYATNANLQWQWQPAKAENIPAVTAVITTAPAISSAGSVSSSASSLSSASSSSSPAVPIIDTADTVLAYMGVSEISGDLKNLQVSTNMSAPVVLSGVIKTGLVDANNYLLTAPLFELAANWQQQTLPAPWWVPGQPTPVTSGAINAEGNWQQYTAELHGDISLPAAPVLRGLSGNMFGVSASVKGDLEKIHIDFLRLRERQIAAVVDTSTNNSSAASSISPAPSLQITETDAGLDIQGDVQWLPQLDWQLQVQAEHLNLVSLFENWPSNINANFNTSGSYVNSAVNIQVEDLQLQGDVRGLNVQGNGNLTYDGKNIHSDALHLIFGANQVRLNGDVGEAFNLDWDINAPMLDQIDGSLHGSVVSKGQLRGNMQKPRLEIDTRIEHFSWGDYAVDSLQLSLAPKEDIVADAANGQSTPPPATQSSTAETNRSTDPAASVPASVAQNVVTAISAEDYSLVFTANQLQVPGNRFSTLGITGNGSINKHRLQALVRHTDLGRADFTLRGGYQDTQWQGQFEHLAIKLKKVPRWWLTSSKSLSVRNGAIIMDRQCFTTRSNLTGQVERISAVDQELVIGEWMPNQSYAKTNYNWLVKGDALPSSPIETYSLPQLCLDGEWSSVAGAQLHANIDSIPLRQFLSLFKVEVYFAGVMDGSLRVNSPDFSLANTKASARVNTRNAELRYQYSGGTTEVYPWREFAVKADLEKGKLVAAGDMEWTGYGRINANADLDLQQQKINSGQFIARFSNLAPLETVLPYANDVKGDFLADLSMGGNFSQPYVVGNVTLHNGTANLPRLGIDLTNIELQVNSSQAGTISLVSQLQSNKGRLSLVGDLNRLGQPDWNVQGFVSGSDVQVINLPQLKANVTPDIKITANSTSLNVAGDLSIPWARANIKSLPETATRVSPDAVIIDDQSAQVEVEEKLKILTNLNLSLGDDVRFQGFGLNSKLTGKINLLKETQRQFFTSGYVSVTEGNYKAYGQELTIDRGRLLFQGPYENPGIEITASRTIRDENNTKVGLEITGTLQRPKATVFSTEKHSDSEAMMMLLTGKPLNEASKADASMLVSAMSGLGGDSGSSLTSGITRFFGVDQLEVKSEDGLEQSELWVGKYLTPRLLVRYVVGIFDQAFRLGMEYQLTERLRIEAESGETQSVDVVYKIER